MTLSQSMEDSIRATHDAFLTRFVTTDDLMNTQSLTLLLFFLGSMVGSTAHILEHYGMEENSYVCQCQRNPNGKENSVARRELGNNRTSLSGHEAIAV